MEEVLRRISQLEHHQRRAADERESLLSRICELEDLVEDLRSQLKRIGVPHRHKPLVNRDSITINNASKQINSQDDEPWLFYCQKGRTTHEILRVLDFTDAYELDASALLSEEALWVHLLERMQAEELPNRLTALRKLAAVQLSSACHHELLLIVRGIPRKEHPLFQHILPQVASLAEYVNIAWSEVENSSPDLLGRIALVLECEEEIKQLSVDRGDIQMSLFVERL